MSIAGGIDKAVERGSKVNCTTIQIFTKSNTQWRATPLKKEEVAEFKKNVERTKITPVFAHNCYLINLASPDPDIYKKSIDTLLLELERSETLGLPYLVMHPGSHMGEGEKAGIERIAESLNKIFEKIMGYNVQVLLETTAGQGRSVGSKFEQIAEIMDLIKSKEKLCVCLDTCHIFAAGYDIRSKYEYEKTMAEFNSIVGIDKIKVIHLNDSKKELGSKVDRHEHIGKGFIGLEAFRYIMNDERFRSVPKVLETPKGEDIKEDVINLKILRSLVRN